MHILKYFLGILLTVMLVFFIGGALINDEWQVSRSLTIHASPEKIYPFVSKFKEWEKWSPWNASKDATLKYTYEDTGAVVGSKQTWTSEKMGNGWMRFTDASPETGVSYDLFIEMGQIQSSLQGNLAFTAVGEETHVTWTDRGHSGGSFVKRWISLLIKPMLGKDMEQGLSDLEHLVEK